MTDFIVLSLACVLLFMFIVSISRKIFILPCSGKVVVISGCDSGFGNGTAKELAKRGCTVFAGCYTDIGIKELEGTPNIIPIHLDITSKDSIEAAYEKVKKQSPKGIWALINNAGIADGLNLEFTSEETYHRVMDVNFFGHLSMTKKFLPLLKLTKGRIINMASVAGRVAHPVLGAYCASKFAMVGWTDSIRMDLRQFGITVIILEPEFFKTPLVLDSPKIVERALQTCSKETLEEYGGEKWGKKMFDSLNLVTDKLAGDPRTVVDTYVNACLSRFPKKCYIVGWLARFLVLVPMWVVELVYALAKND